MFNLIPNLLLHLLNLNSELIHLLHTTHCTLKLLDKTFIFPFSSQRHLVEDTVRNKEHTPLLAKLGQKSMSN